MAAPHLPAHSSPLCLPPTLFFFYATRATTVRLSDMDGALRQRWAVQGLGQLGRRAVVHYTACTSCGSPSQVLVVRQARQGIRLLSSQLDLLRCSAVLRNWLGLHKRHADLLNKVAGSRSPAFFIDTGNFSSQAFTAKSECIAAGYYSSITVKTRAQQLCPLGVLAEEMISSSTTPDSSDLWLLLLAYSRPRR